MTAFIIGTKGKQTQWFDEKNLRRNSTQIAVGDCYVVDCKTLEKDGYFSVKLGVRTRQPRNVTKSLLGQTKKAGITSPLNFFKEIRIPVSLKPQFVEEDGKKGLKIDELFFYVGMKVTPDLIFKAGDVISVTGTSKGKGFQGVVHRHGFRGGPRTHGQSDRERSPGSIGNRTIPGRVFKGKRMAGRMGSDTVTVKGLKVVSASVDSVIVQGLVPGSVKSLILVKTQN